MKSISFAILCLLGLARADQPVHCVRDKLFGQWYFHVASQDTTVNLYQTKELCTHNVPNKIQLVNAEHQFFFEKEDLYKINLLEDFKAEAVLCRNNSNPKTNDAPPNCDSQLITGRWTAIYDQALNIELDNGQRFLANLRYNLKHEVAQDPLMTAQKSGGVSDFSTIETSDYDKFDSDCARTMVGFVQNIPSQTGKSYTMSQHTVKCFHGYQKKLYGYEESEAHDNGKLKWNSVTKHHGDVAKLDLLASSDNATSKKKAQHGVGEKTKNGLRKSLIENGSGHKKNALIKGERAKKRQNMHQEHRPSDEMDLLISAVNEADLGWTADVCKYQKNHPKHGGDKCDEKAALLAQLTSDNTETGFFDDFNVDELTTALQGMDAEDKNKFGDMSDQKFVAALNKAQKYMKTFASPDDIPDSELPETLDFRDIDGYDFTSYFRDQGKCGSCYTISMTQVMEARLKLKYGKQPPMLSPQMLMTCNYMNEGCDGGWPHFNILLAENAHLVSEKCAPYKQSTKGASCSAFSKCAPIAKVEKSYQVGGGWGATSERKMMKEILRNGPINGDFQAPRIFSLYKEGIFSEKGLLDIHRKQQEMLQLAQVSKPDRSLAETEETQDLNQISDKTLNEKGVSWVEMNHSVVIIGWGKDKESNAKYWIVRNSYGPNWGMQGDFYVKRGNNDFGMEVENYAFLPTMCTEDSTNDVCKPVQ